MAQFKTQTKGQLERFLNSASTEQLHDMKLLFDDLYYNAETDLEDWRYDMLKETLIERDPEYSVPVGSKLRENEVEIKLPYWLGSMDKIKRGEEEQLEKWKRSVNKEKKENVEYIVSDKLDGVSCLLVTNEEGNVSLYTRGDGTIGKDITYISRYINCIPKNLPPNLNVRGELVMSKKNFQKMEGEKVSSRNTVSGLVKAKTARKALRDVDFVAYEIIHEGEMEKLSEQYDRLIEMDFRVVQNFTLSILDGESLEREIQMRKEKSYYEIDGLVIQIDDKYKRNVDRNPKYSFAYKSDISIETTVIEVEWNISMFGKLKPRVKIEPVFLSGATINYATGHNAAFIEKNEIGPGARIEIIRSGEVIPRIMEVLVPCPNGPSMPNIPYRWDDEVTTDEKGEEIHVDVFALNPGSEINVKILMHFMKTMKVKHVSEQTIRKMVEHGWTNVEKILNASKEEILELPGFKDKLVERTYTNLHEAMKDVDISTIMAASNAFGFGVGVKRMKLMNKEYPELYREYGEYDVDDLLNRIQKVEGFSGVMANKIVDGLPKFTIFMRKIEKHVTIKKEEKKERKKNLEGMKVVCSGFRGIFDEEIEARGGKVTTSISKSTNILIIKEMSNSSKVQKAVDLGIRVYTIEEFREKYIK
jgi:DNA ligase (NAD+)